MIALLCYLATSKMQNCASKGIGLSQQTVCNIFTQTLDVLSSQDAPSTVHQLLHHNIYQRKKTEFRAVVLCKISLVSPMELTYGLLDQKSLRLRSVCDQPEMYMLFLIQNTKALTSMQSDRDQDMMHGFSLHACLFTIVTVGRHPQ